jgi:hypothetical protein
MTTQEQTDPVMQQAQKILDLGILKASLSSSFRTIDGQYRAIIEKILNPTELLSEEECQVVLSKDFSKALGSFAQASSKITQWHRENKVEDAIAFLLPEATVKQVNSQNSIGVELKN